MFISRLPGRSLAKNQAMWLCNTHQADSKVFTRSLLAKVSNLYFELELIFFHYRDLIIVFGFSVFLDVIIIGILSECCYSGKVSIFIFFSYFLVIIFSKCVNKRKFLFLGLYCNLQTVICFPYLGGIVELGVTELVSI